jgi:tripartite-type tricarboxylate transporter receptor subunit TctC
VVPVAPGGGTDFTARLLADKPSVALGQPVVVENRPGGAGNVAVAQVAAAPADGYTLVMPITSFPINPSLYKLPFDTVKDFAPVVLAGTLPLVLVVNPAVPAKNVAELIALAQADPARPVTFANSSTGTTAHLAGELFNHLARTRMVSVPYKGGGPAVNDLLGGHVNACFSTIIRAAATSRAARFALWPSPGPRAVRNCRRCPPSPNPGSAASTSRPGSGCSRLRERPRPW